MKNWINRLLDEAGDGDGGGSLLTASQGGGEPPTPKGGTNTGAGATGGDSSSGNPNPSNNPTSGQSQDWKLALPKELQEDASIKGFTSLPALVKSYVHAQKLIGADKIPIPGKHATEEDWKNVFTKLGLPSKEEEYKVEFKNEKMQAELGDKFKKAAFSAGVLPSQAQKLAEWMEAYNSEVLSSHQEQRKQQFSEELNGLKKEWGGAFDKNVARARAVVAKYADESTVEYLEKTGLANDIQLVRMFAKVGELLKEDEVAQTGGVAGISGSLSPAEAKAAAQKIIADMHHPYHIKDHPNHKAAVAEVSNLFRQAYTS